MALAGRQAYAREWMNRVLHDAAYAREYYGVRLDEPRRRARQARAQARRPAGPRRAGAAASSRSARPSGSALVTGPSGLGAERIVTLDHHTCHAAAAYFGSPFGGAPALVLTNDNSGDGLCATASSAARHRRSTRREATPSAPGSLGSFYSFVTLLLGMKFGEHEYKVMGLAPYAPAARAPSAPPPRSREVFGLAEDTPATFAWRRRGPALPRCCWRPRWGCASTRSPAAPSRWWRRRCCAGPGSCASATAASGWPSAAACS